MSMMTHVIPEADSVTINATEVTATLDGVLCGLISIDGWHNGPGVRRDKTPRLWAHGDFTERGWRSGRLITLTGHVRTQTRAEAADFVDLLAATYAEGTSGRFSFEDPDQGTRWADVGLESEPKTDWKLPTRIDWQLELYAADPRKYGQSVSDVTGVPVDGGGLGFDLFTQGTLGVLDFGESGDPGFLELTNAGSADTGPVFTVTGDCPDGFTITNRVTGARLVYSAPVFVGQPVVLDASYGSVMVDGVDAGPALVRREFEMLDGGETGSWLLTAPNSVDALLRVEVTPAWW